MFSRNRKLAPVDFRSAWPKTGRTTQLLLIASCLLAGLVFLANCQKEINQPIAITAEDMCSFCRMSISEKRYAAELLDAEGQPFKFDDIGCMSNFIKEKRNKNEVRAYFVMDFDKQTWIKAENAYYIRSTELTTPMSGGIIAFENQSSAQEALDKYHGTLLGFDELFTR